MNSLRKNIVFWSIAAAAFFAVARNAQAQSATGAVSAPSGVVVTITATC